MFGDVRFPLYELFGHLIPGTIALLSLIILHSAIFDPDSTLVWPTLSFQVWIAVLLVALIMGNLVNGLGHWLRDALVRWRVSATILELSVAPTLPSATVELARIRISKLMGLEGYDLNKELGDWLLLRSCETVLDLNGKSEEFEVFRYRLAFYGGLVVAFCLLCVSLAVRLRDPVTIALSNTTYTVGRIELAFALALSLVAVSISVRQYKRVYRARFRRAIVSYLAVSSTSVECTSHTESV